MRRHHLQLVAWIALLGAVGWLGASSSVGPTPSQLADIDALNTWVESATPQEVAATIIRYGLLLATLWFGALTAAALSLRLVRAPKLALAVAGRLPAAARRSLRPVLAGTLAVTVTASSMAGASAQSHGNADADERVESSRSSTTTTTSPTEGSSATAVLTHIDLGWPDYDYPTTPADLDAPKVAPAVSGPASTTWTVQAGDHLWSIAERTAPKGASLSDIGRHWLEIIELNRAALPDPSNPDLIFPGMTVRIPGG